MQVGEAIDIILLRAPSLFCVGQARFTQLNKFWREIQGSGPTIASPALGITSKLKMVRCEGTRSHISSHGRTWKIEMRLCAMIGR